MGIQNRIVKFSLAVACLGGMTLIPSVLFSASSDLMANKERQVVKVAEGVYVIRHKEDPSPGFVFANTTVIIGERETFVVDSGQTPTQALEDIAQIRTLTDKPVRYLVNTHWHTDHNGGNHEYMAAFPSISIISTAETRKMMDEFAPHVVNSWLSQATTSREGLTQMLKNGKGADGKPFTDEKIAAIRDRLKMVDNFTADAKNFVYQQPTLTFEHELALDAGAGREIEVRFLGKANTAGDAIVYLPKEKVLITGDVLDYPIPLAFGGYPSEWIQTLRRLAEFDVSAIVPGHGQVLYDKDYLNKVAELMTYIVNQVDKQFQANPDVTLEEVKKLVDLQDYRAKFAQGDQNAGAFFDMSIRDGFVEAAYYERKER